MKAKSILSVLAGTIACMAVFTACSGKSDKAAAGEEEAGNDVLTVDQVLADPDKYVGDTITVEGVCSHLCAHGAMKAFLQGSADTLMLRAEANPHIGEPFPVALVHRNVAIKGILAEQRIDSAAVAGMETQHKAAVAEAEAAKEPVEKRHETGSCATERAAQGQSKITDFDARMEDYRQKIAARAAKEGKNYLSFYYLEALSYEVLPE